MGERSQWGAESDYRSGMSWEVQLAKPLAGPMGSLWENLWVQSLWESQWGAESDYRSGMSWEVQSAKPLAGPMEC